ncbi:hypothetical protein D3C86_1292420 [compost metagenome]
MSFDIQKLPDGALFRVFRARRITRCRANALVVFTDQLFVAEVLIRSITPVNFTYPLMQVFRERFCQAIGEGFQHDFVVIVVLRLVRVSERVLLQPTGDSKRADVVRFATEFWRHEIGQTVVGKTDFLGLLTQMTAHRQHVGAGFIAINFDVIPDTVRREQAHNAAWIEALFST